MAPPPPSDQPIQRQMRGAPIKLLIPLIYAPVLPLMRLTLRHNPVVRDRLFTAVLAGAFAHGFYLVTDIYMTQRASNLVVARME